MSFILNYLDKALDTVTGRYDGQESDGKSEKGDAVDGDVNVEAEAAGETRAQLQSQRDSSSGINSIAARELLGARSVPDSNIIPPVAANLEEPSRIPSHSTRLDSSEAGGSLLSSAEDRPSLLPHGSGDDNSSAVSSAGSHAAFSRPQATAREGARILAVGQGKMENMVKEVMSHRKLQQERRSFFSGQVAREGSEQTGEQQQQNDDEPPSLQVSLKPRSDRERLPELEAKALEEEALRAEKQRKRGAHLERERMQKLEEDEHERLMALEAAAAEHQQRLEDQERLRALKEEALREEEQWRRGAQLERERLQKLEEDERARLMALEAEALQRLEDERQRRKAEEEEEDRERQRLRSAAVAAEAEAAAGRAVVEGEEKDRKAQEQGRQLRLEEEEQERQRCLAVDKERDLERRQAEERTASVTREKEAAAEAAEAAAAEEKEETRRVRLDRETQALAAQEEERRHTALVKRQVDNGDTTAEAGTPARGVNHEDSRVTPLPAELPLPSSAADRARAREEAWAEARMLAEGKARTQAMRVAASREGAEEGKDNATGEPSGGAATATAVTAALSGEKGVGVRRRGGEEVDVEEGSNRSSRRPGSVAAADDIAENRDSGAAGAVLPTATAAETGRLGLWGSLFAGGRRHEGPGVGSASSVTSSQVRDCVPHAIAVLWMLRVVGLGSCRCCSQEVCWGRLYCDAFVDGTVSTAEFIVSKRPVFVVARACTGVGVDIPRGYKCELTRTNVRASLFSCARPKKQKTKQDSLGRPHALVKGKSPLNETLSDCLCFCPSER